MHIASFPVSTPQLFFAPCKKITYCKRQKLEWRPGNEANMHVGCYSIDLHAEWKGVSTWCVVSESRSDLMHSQMIVCIACAPAHLKK